VLPVTIGAEPKPGFGPYWALFILPGGGPS